ncbi:MAG: hypothetical protein A3J79_01480 [Elusimicrobia bacterium RIFOXYB2_FULL_62_6]|nr:MAG: hypothetical protein A3J79_01480 [Elusimicrobia bacterium RIFOXYB2_FULL_62_6]
MKKKALILLATLCVAAAGALLRYYSSSMDAAEAVRRLAGMRVAMTLFKISKGSPPKDFRELTAGGQLEAPMDLKLKWHGTSSQVRHAPALRAEDNGGWGYVNDPASPDFGTIFIDCLHRDERGRYWSEF